MKKFFSLLFVLAAAINISIAQVPFVVVSGYVTNAQTGYAVAGQLMYISVDSLNYPGYTSQVATNDNGYYTDTIPLSPNSTQGLVVVSTSDCNGTMASATAFFFPGIELIVLDFNICGDPVSGCNAGFRFEPASNNELSFHFFDESFTMPGSTIDQWFWQFGDGTTSDQQNPIHTYQLPGMYDVCLNISSADSLCSSSFCMNVPAGFITPDSCVNYFVFYPDSNYQSVTFEGWTLNGQADSWLWDFGDGTTGNGQTVTHAFSDPNIVYTVCLTTTGPGYDSIPCTAISCQPVSLFVPPSCESDFWFHPDSTGTVLLFEGWAMNTQIDTWFWDFGDGTSATGQTVSHEFPNNNTPYTVCLTTTGINPGGDACTYTSCQVVNPFIPLPCNNFFEAMTNDGLTYVFNGHLVSGAPASYVWNFGDGSTGYGQQITHTFQPNGQVYTVCLTTFSGDPAANDTCVSTSCQVIIPGGGGGCQAMMTAQPEPDGYTWHFEDVSQSPHSFSFWDFGDGDQSSLTNPVHMYNAPGIYTVCLSISDSLNLCWDQTCMEIIVDMIQPGCQASFVVFPADSLPAPYTFMFFNTSLPGFSNQQWSFGDGTGSTEPNPIHTYAETGFYPVCLTIWDSAGTCQSTYCMNVAVGGPAGDNTIAGQVIAGNAMADQGLVWLIGADNYYFSETTLNPNGTYTFGGVPAGSYYIYALLTPGSPQFFNYLPTYYESSLTWQGATIVTAGEPNGWYPVQLLPATAWGQGNASINGIITRSGSLKNGGAPASNVEIILYAANGLPIASVFSGEDGSFVFSNLPYGEYTIQAEMTGMTTEAVTLMLSEDNSAGTINFIISGNSIAALGIDEPDLPKLIAGKPYPNPVTDKVYIDLNGSQTGNCRVEIIDLQGRSLVSEITTLSAKDRLEVSTAGLPDGMYLLKISSEGYQPVQRKFVK